MLATLVASTSSKALSTDNVENIFGGSDAFPRAGAIALK